MTVLALKRVVEVVAGQSPSSDAVQDFVGEGLPFLQGNAEFGVRSPRATSRCDDAPKVAHAGDVLLSVRAPVGALNIADRSYGVGRGLAALRPRGSAVESRFLWWAMHALVPALHAEAVGSTYDAVSSEDIARLRFALPTSSAQHAIAHYLDVETARLDVLVAKKRRMVELINARRTAVIEEDIRRLHDVYGSVPLKYLARRVEVGIVVTPAKWYAEAGVLALRGLNIKPGAIVLDDVVTISHEGHQLHRKSELRAGDVVVVRTGQAGAAAVIPDSLEGCNCIDLVIVRPSLRTVPRFLEFVLNSDWAQKHIEEFSVGTIQSHFNVGAMKQIPVPVPPADEQHRIADHLVAITDRLESLSRRLWTQIDLLSEHRQALVTKAVTGELDIPRSSA